MLSRNESTTKLAFMYLVSLVELYKMLHLEHSDNDHVLALIKKRFLNDIYTNYTYSYDLISFISSMRRNLLASLSTLDIANADYARNANHDRNKETFTSLNLETTKEVRHFYTNKQAARSNPTNFLVALPQDIFALIAILLSDNALLTLRQTSKRLNTLATMDSVWQRRRVTPSLSNFFTTQIAVTNRAMPEPTETNLTALNYRKFRLLVIGTAPTPILQMMGILANDTDEHFTWISRADHSFLIENHHVTLSASPHLIGGEDYYQSANLRYHWDIILIALDPTDANVMEQAQLIKDKLMDQSSSASLFPIFAIVLTKPYGHCPHDVTRKFDGIFPKFPIYAFSPSSKDDLFAMLSELVSIKLDSTSVIDKEINKVLPPPPTLSP